MQTSVLGLQLACTVRLKGKLTHADTVHTNYWLKAQFHQPVLVCTVRKTCQHFFANGNNAG